MGRSGVGRRVLDLAAAAARAATMQPKAEGGQSLKQAGSGRRRHANASPCLALPRHASPAHVRRLIAASAAANAGKKEPSLALSSPGHGITPRGPAKSNPNSKVELHRPTAAAPTPRPHRWQPQAGAALARRRAFLFVARSSSAQQQELSFIWARASAAAWTRWWGVDRQHTRTPPFKPAATHRSPLLPGSSSGKTASIAQRSARVDRKLRGVRSASASFPWPVVRNKHAIDA
ncbi:hypothetical protein PaG_05200 [Moesziomyces aphidis]|uniref:Uncharacterized protein n=1 Tax=Moesziomyces aphidis TaxID=84754 RepID=W3VHX4_MOEAP|nr:hypothetical protein PaG_05200 [Moesziomyces aphidis]